jgi:hypothetical protein
MGRPETTPCSSRDYWLHRQRVVPCQLGGGVHPSPIGLGGHGCTRLTRGARLWHVHPAPLEAIVLPIMRGGAARPHHQWMPDHNTGG